MPRFQIVCSFGGGPSYWRSTAGSCVSFSMLPPIHLSRTWAPIRHPCRIQAMGVRREVGHTLRDVDFAAQWREGTGLMSSAYGRYLTRQQALQNELLAEAPAIEAAADLLAECIGSGGLVHVFGSGHSHMMAEEVFY